MDLDEAMSRATAELEAAEAQLAAVQGRVEELRTIRDGLRAALQRYGDAATAKPAKPKEDFRLRIVENAPPGAGKATQAELVQYVLGTAGRPLSTVEVREAVNALDQQFNREQIRSALHYLVRKGRISRVSPGLWELPGARKATTSFGPAEDTARPNGAGESAKPYQQPLSPERT